MRNLSTKCFWVFSANLHIGLATFDGIQAQYDGTFSLTVCSTIVSLESRKNLVSYSRLRRNERYFESLAETRLTEPVPTGSSVLFQI